MEQQMDLMADLVHKLSGELRTGLQPAYENFIGFFHAIDWKVMITLFSLLLIPFRISSVALSGIVGLHFIL